MADDEPMVREAESTSFSTCPKEGTTSPLRIKSGLISPATRMSKVLLIILPGDPAGWVDVGHFKSVIFIPIEGCVSGVEIADGFAKIRAQRGETGETFAPGGAQEFEPRLPVHTYRFLPDCTPCRGTG